MSNLIQGSLAKIKEAARRPIWEEPNLHYDGSEPPKGWLGRLKQLRQIHGYNDKEIVYIAERCMRGSAQLWFRIHQPKSFEALRTGLHTRFASGPVLVPTTVSLRTSAGRSGSVFPSKSNFGSVVQWDVASNSSPPNRLERIAKSNVSADNDTLKYSCPSDRTSKTTYRSDGSRVDSNSRTALAQSKSDIASSNFNQATFRNRRNNCSLGVRCAGGKAGNVSCNHGNGRGSEDFKVFQVKSLSDAKSRVEIQTAASSSKPREGDNSKDKEAKSMDTTSISLTSMRFDSGPTAPEFHGSSYLTDFLTESSRRESPVGFSADHVRSRFLQTLADTTTADAIHPNFFFS